METVVDGRVVSQNKTVVVRGGQELNVAFNGSNDSPVAKANDKTLKTTLILNVPADAKVTLAGNATNQTGTIREFATDGLAAGSSWENYVVRVETVVEGRVAVQEKTITLTAGEERPLSFDFAPETTVTRTASR
ncbi:MAG: TIGR03000 domain-containing protein [Pirellulales bacterium]